MFSLSIAWKITRDLGLPWVLKRAAFSLQARLGFLERRLPVSKWDFDRRDWLLEPVPEDPEQFKQCVCERLRFLSCPSKPSSLLDPENVCRRADRILAGEWQFFSRHWFQVGFPPDWHRNALDGMRADEKLHWSRIDTENIRDVKFIWEPSRFSAVYLLVRAYGATKDERYAEAFWNLFEDWAEKNPPNVGVNWVSGQEAAFRVMSWCFGLGGFFSSPSSTAARVLNLVRVIEKHGERIAGFIEYALSQRNNHGISEAAGLFTIAVLFPQLRRAEEWREVGRELIIKQLQEQVYQDGSYIQHSFNYERVMLDDMVWVIRLGELNEARFPPETYELLATAARFMLQFCDPKTGRMPNYGGNDGSLVLPLSSCDYQDFRPSIQAAYYLTHREFCFGNGPWNEVVDRLFHDDPSFSSAAHPQTSRLESASKSSQYMKLQARESYCMLRAARYRNRPAQADQLHVDLWWRGENIACDAGTYLYNGADPWSNVLAGTNVHNTVSIADKDQMTRAGRFLCLDWAQADSACYRVDSRGMAIEAEHDGYRSLGITHRRSVLSIRDMDAYVVVDDLLGNSSSGRLRLHWLFPRCPFFWDEKVSTLVLQTSAGEFKYMIGSSQPSAISIATAGEIVAGMQVGQKKTDSVRGWRSLYYGEKEAALSFAAETEARLPVRFVSVLAPAELVTTANELGVTFRSKDTDRQIALRRCGTDRIFNV
jgi:hypothetical protein